MTTVRTMEETVYEKQGIWSRNTVIRTGGKSEVVKKAMDLLQNP